MSHRTRRERFVLSRQKFLVPLSILAIGLLGPHMDVSRASSALAETPVQTNADLKPRLGQLFIFGLNGPKLDARMRQHITETRAGSFILFRRNLVSNKQVSQFNNDLHALALELTGIPAFIGLDQEGGKVVRIPFRPSLPSPLAVGRSRDPQLAEELGFQVGLALKQLGFNLNFAPVLDLGSETEYSFLGQRAFSADPQVVAQMGVAFSKGHNRAKVLPIAKHFPGIGPVPNDPHLSLVRRSVSFADLQNKDLIPFDAFAKLPTSGVMISHLIYPKLDPSETPGTFSKVITQDLLRDKMKYEGLIVTDDLMMAGAQASKDFQENVIKAYLAGADLLMVSWSEPRQRQALAAIWKGLESGRISRQSVVTKLDRIEKMKSQVKLEKPASATNPNLLLVYNYKPYENLLERILKKSLSFSTKELNGLRSERLLVSKNQAKILSSLSGNRNIQQAPNSKLIQVLQNEMKIEESVSSQLPRSYWVMFVRNKLEDQLAAQIPADIRSRILLVNLWRPDLKSGAFKNQIGLFMSHPRKEKILVDWIGQRLKSDPVVPALVQPLSERRRFGLYPNPHRPEIRSTNATQAASADLDPLLHSRLNP